MLPVFGVTQRALWFVVTNLFTLFRLSWLPITALVAAGYGLAYGVIQVSPDMAQGAIEDSDLFAAAEFAELLLQGLALSVVAVSVHRIIPFDERGSGEYLAFPFGRTELLYVLMGAITYAVLITILAVLVGGASVLVGVIAGKDPTQLMLTLVDGGVEKMPAMLSAVVAVGTYVVAVWAMLRLTVWPPAVVANNRLSLAEALSLSKGNVLSLLALMVLSSAAFGAAAIVLAALAYREQNFDLLELVDGVSFGHKVERLLDASLNPNNLLFEFVFQFLATTYTVAVLSYAYKALKGYDLDTPLTQQADAARSDLAPGARPMGAL